MAEAITTERFGGIKEAFQILTDCPRVTVYADPNGDKVSREGGHGRPESWRIGMKVGDGHWAVLHEMGHVIFDSFGGAEKFLAKFEDKRIHTIWNAAEDVRIERLAQRHFDKPIWRHHKQALIDQAESYGMKSLDNLIHMVQGLLYDLPLPLGGTETERKALEYFKEDLIASTRSKDSADTAKVAIRIAHYMDWLDKVSAPPKPPEPRTPTDEPGGGDGDDGDDTEPGDGPLGDPDRPADVESEDTPTSYTGQGAEDHDDDDDDAVPDVPDDDVLDIFIKDAPPSPIYDESSEDDLLETLGKAAKSIHTSERRAETRENKKKEEAEHKMASKGHRIVYGFDEDGKSKADEDDHVVHMLKWVAEDVVMSDASRFVLENAESAGTGRSRYTGIPSRKAWRLTYGDTKVFRKPPKHKGKLVCMVDMSSSMGCGCERHKNEHGTVANAWLAWQTVSVLSSRFPDMEVFGFTSSDTKNFIVPFPSQKQPDCRIKQIRRGHETGGGNADCASLLWLDEYLGLFSNGSSAIVISDGMPAGPFPLRCGCVTHTKKVAKMMNDKGVSYASVLIRTDDRGLYPNELTTTINEVNDIRNLQEVLDWINAK
jgi:hypothetical protein